MYLNCPYLVNNRDELVNKVGNFLEMRRNVVANVNWLFPEAPAELCDIRNGCCI